MELYTRQDKTLKELTTLLTSNGVEYFIKKKRGCVVKMHFIVKDDDYDLDSFPHE